MSSGHERLDVYRAAIELGRRGYTVAEEAVGFAGAGIDSDTDSDPEGAAGIGRDGYYEPFFLREPMLPCAGKTISPK
jgi:hypothetical protein